MEKLHKICSIASCIALLCIGLQATELSETSYCDDSTCTINENIESSSTSDNVFDVSSDDYTSITVESGVIVKADTSGSVIDISGTVSGNVTNNGTLTNTTGNVITIDGGTVGGTITNTGTMTSESGYGIYIDEGSEVTGNICNGNSNCNAMSSSTATMSGIYINGTVTGYIYNYNVLTEGPDGYSLYVDTSGNVYRFDNYSAYYDSSYHQQMGDVYNAGTISTFTNQTNAIMGNLYNVGTISVFTNYATMGDVYNDGTISSTFTNRSIMGDFYNDVNGNINTFYGAYSSSAIAGDVYNYGNITTFYATGYNSSTTATGTMGNIYNYNYIERFYVYGGGTVEGIYNYYGSSINSLSIISTTSSRSTIEYLYNAGDLTFNTSNAIQGTIDVLYNAESGTINNFSIGSTSSTSSTANALYGEIGSIINYGTMSYIYFNNVTSSSNNSISSIYNYGTMGAIRLYNSSKELYLYNQGTMNLASNINAGSGKYVQIYSYNSDINIGYYYLYITEDHDTFNDFTIYTSSTTTDLSHLAIAVNGSTITLSGTIEIEFGGDFYNTDYSLYKLVALYNTSGTALTDYESYGLSLDDIYDAIYYGNTLEYYKIRSSDETFQIAKRSTNEITGMINNNFNKYSPAHAFYKNNIITMNTLLTQSESIMYNASSQRYGFRATRSDKAIASNGAKKDYVVSNKKPYSDFIKTAAYNEDSSSNEDSQYSVESSAYNTLESSDDYFFFSPFISNNVLYDSKRLKGDGLSYGFISGYNKEIGNSLVGFQIGFDYGTFNGENATSYLDVDSISALLGLHYRYDFSNGMFIKVRGDAYYAYHTINDIYVGSYSASANQHPNTIGVNVGITTGKQWNFTDRDSALFGVFNVEGGLNYIGLYNTKFDFYGNYDDAQYTEYHKDSFMNLLYAGVDVKYDKMFGSNWIADWIINMALGVKALVTPLPEAKVSAVSTYYDSDTMYDTSSKVYTNRVFGTALLGIDCRIGENVSLMLNYVGIYGDKSMSNSGFFNVRVWW